jgi:hypothetical protein
MAADDLELKKVAGRLAAVAEDLHQSVGQLAKLDIDWAIVPPVRGPIGFLDQACTQNNQCTPDQGCQHNSACK